MLLLLLLFLSCEKEAEDDPFYSKTLIVYMAADNDLSSDAGKNIEQIIEGCRLLSKDNNVVIYIDSRNDQPSVFQIRSGRKILQKTYSDHNSATPEVMESVLTDIVHTNPSLSYSLILWSHGTSWLPENASLRSFGKEKSREIDIIDLEKSLPVHFDLILFDACLMGSVEVAFQLKEKTDYIIASPAQIIVDGFPYDKIMNLFFGDEQTYRQIVEEYYLYYSGLDGAWKSAIAALIKTDELENLAVLTLDIISSYPLDKWNYNEKSVQLLDPGLPVYHDFYDFLKKNYPASLLDRLDKQLEKVVLYKITTNKILDEISIREFCGFSSYIPNPDYPLLNEYYKKLSWCHQSGYHLLF